MRQNLHFEGRKSCMVRHQEMLEMESLGPMEYLMQCQERINKTTAPSCMSKIAVFS